MTVRTLADVRKLLGQALSFFADHYALFFRFAS
jgi:hypothetical protein